MAHPEQPTQPVKESRRREVRKAAQLTPQAHDQLNKASRKLKLSRQDYASAAIGYFAETGLDPRKVSKASLAKVEQRVVQETYDVREHNANIGNRLVGVIRTFERNISLMVQQQQAGTFKYLEGIERNILSYLMNIEEDLLTTILERVVASNVENHMNRVMLQVASLQLDAKRFPFSESEVEQLTVSYDRQRDSQIVVESEKLLETKRARNPRITASPSFVEIPKAPVTAKPVTGSTSAAATNAPPVGTAASSR